MSPEFGQAYLDSEIVFDRVLGSPDLDMLQHGQIVFAGKVTLDAIPGIARNSIVSIYFQPKLTADGQLDLKLTGVYGGKLPLPVAFHLAGYGRVVSVAIEDHVLPLRLH